MLSLDHDIDSDLLMLAERLMLSDAAIDNLDTLCEWLRLADWEILWLLLCDCERSIDRFDTLADLDLLLEWNALKLWESETDLLMLSDMLLERDML